MKSRRTPSRASKSPGNERGGGEGVQAVVPDLDRAALVEHEAAEKRAVEKILEAPQVPGVHRRGSLPGLDLERKIASMRKADEKIDLAPVLGPQVAQLDLDAQRPDELLDLRDHEGLYGPSIEIAPGAQERSQNPDIRRLRTREATSGRQERQYTSEWMISLPVLLLQQL